MTLNLTLSGFCGKQDVSRYRCINNGRSGAQAAFGRILVSQQQIYLDLLQMVSDVNPTSKGFRTSWPVPLAW